MAVTINKKSKDGASISTKVLNIALGNMSSNGHNSSDTILESIDADNALDKNKVMLIDATQMYQPVFSTSKESTYHVVALGSVGLKMAARYKNGVLSLRVEGTVIEHAEYFTDSGFNFSKPAGKKEYTSLHLNAKSLVMAKRALGAVLGQLHGLFTSGIPNLELIKTKGL